MPSTRIQVDPRRVVALNRAKPGLSGPVVYWMSRDQRSQDNWALLYATQLAAELETKVEVVFCLTPSFLGATFRQFDFMLTGLAEIEGELTKHGIKFSIISGEPVKTLLEYCNGRQIKALVTDFSPLRIGREWRAFVARELPVSMFEVDAHNIVPAWLASDKQEYAARTIRPKIRRQVVEFLVEIPKLPKQENEVSSDIDWSKIRAGLSCDKSVLPVEGITPGEKAARKQLTQFVEKRLEGYDALRNDPNENSQSDLSPYLHFGQVSAQRIALEVLKTPNTKDREAFLEELIVRRELADNFCLYNPNYDSAEGFPSWAKKTLDAHKNDKREYVYSLKQFEEAKTHDRLWNAAQNEMKKTGKMHGYMRMYWAKKILEWTKNPEQAIKIAIYLNDKYELDGRDPNGYAGIAWSIGGVHDRPWFNRPVYGSIRYMSAGGAKGKFNVEAYCNRWQG